MVGVVFPARQWSYFGVTSEENVSGENSSVLSQQFCDVNFKLNRSFEHLSSARFYDIFVSGFPGVPNNLIPGGGFLPVGNVRSGDSLDDYFLASLKKSVSQDRSDVVVEVVVMPGPAFEYHPLLPDDELARDPSVEEVVWMRWDLQNN